MVTVYLLVAVGSCFHMFLSLWDRNLLALGGWLAACLLALDSLIKAAGV